MAETTDTTPVETGVPAHACGKAFVTVQHGGDALGHTAVVAWRGDTVRFTRSSSGRPDEITTTERDAVTENALLAMAVPGVLPPADFSMVLMADDGSGTWPRSMGLRVRGGKAEIVNRGGPSYPAPYPAWFLSALRDILLVPGDDDEGE